MMNRWHYRGGWEGWGRGGGTPFSALFRNQPRGDETALNKRCHGIRDDINGSDIIDFHRYAGCVFIGEFSRGKHRVSRNRSLRPLTLSAEERKEKEAAKVIHWIRSLPSSCFFRELLVRTGTFLESGTSRAPFLFLSFPFASLSLSLSLSLFF